MDSSLVIGGSDGQILVLEGLHVPGKAKQRPVSQYARDRKVHSLLSGRRKRTLKENGLSAVS